MPPQQESASIPSEDEHALTRGVAHLRRREWRQAHALFTQALDAEPDSPAGWEGLASAAICLDDAARLLAGHPEGTELPAPPAAIGPWMASATWDMTAWSGPWGIRFAANLTSARNTGLGTWTECRRFTTASPTPSSRRARPTRHARHTASGCRFGAHQ